MALSLRTTHMKNGELQVTNNGKTFIVTYRTQNVGTSTLVNFLFLK